MTEDEREEFYNSLSERFKSDQSRLIHEAIFTRRITR
jgi:hypothetical protein